MFIHASNTTGTGASHVIVSFIKAASSMGLLKSSVVYLPANGPLSNFQTDDLKIIRYKRFLPNSISRAIECLFAKYFFPKDELAIVLGDIPLRGIKNQIVLVHQPNLISPSVNPYSSKTLRYRIYRALFKYNLRFAKKIIVQTEVIADELTRTYSAIQSKIFVIPQPVPIGFSLKNYNIHKTIDRKVPIIFFYPAAGYPHKNHQFLLSLNNYYKRNYYKDIDFEIWLTLSDEEYIPFRDIPYLKNLGVMDYEEVLNNYNKCDALLFLSHSESYGLPLVEAMSLSLPILVVDLAYAKWMCDDKAYYFKYNSIESFETKKSELIRNILNGIMPDYTNELEKFPKTWNEVVSKFLK
jgi:hypothetical protein